MDFFGGVKCTEKTLRSWVRGSQFKCLESLDFHGQVHTREFSQMASLVIKLFSLNSKPSSFFLRQGLVLCQPHFCLASCSLLDSANRGRTSETVRMKDREGSCSSHLLTISVSITPVRFLHPGGDICSLRDISTC